MRLAVEFSKIQVKFIDFTHLTWKFHQLYTIIHSSIPCYLKLDIHQDTCPLYVDSSLWIPLRGPPGGMKTHEQRVSQILWCKNPWKQMLVAGWTNLFWSGIYWQLGDYMPPTTFKGNQKQPLTWEKNKQWIGRRHERNILQHPPWIQKFVQRWHGNFRIVLSLKLT